MSENAPPLAPVTRDPRQPADFDPVALGKMLLRGARLATLATLDPGCGFPFATLVTLATDLDGVPLILVSGLSVHTRNLRQDARLSLLINQSARVQKGDPMAYPRLTLQARASEAADAATRQRLRSRFLARHPKAATYADFADFTFMRLEPEAMHLNGGFARAFDGDARHLLCEIRDMPAFAAFAQAALAELNERGGVAALLASAAAPPAGRAQGGWRATALDPEGLDLSRGDEVIRLLFPHRVDEPAALKSALAALGA